MQNVWTNTNINKVFRVFPSHGKPRNVVQIGRGSGMDDQQTDLSLDDDTSGASSATRPRRSAATGASESVISHGRARKRHDAVSAPATTNDRIAHRAWRRNILIAKGYTQQEAENADKTSLSSIDSNKPPNSAIEHREVKSRHGRAH